MTGAFAGERALVIGFGASGRAAAGALLREGAGVRVSEAGPAEGLEVPAELRGVDLRAGGHRPGDLEGATLVVLSPGVPERAPVVSWAAERGLRVWSELELGARLYRGPIVAVTGTNGKTTTTEIVAAAMRAAGLSAAACGNVGYPFSTAAARGFDALAVECSSFQLRFTESLHPRVSALLNLAPDHLDWHGGFEAYAQAKARVFRLQGEGDVHVGDADDPTAAAVSRGAPCEVRWFRQGAPDRGQTGPEDGRVISFSDEGRIDLGRPRAGGRAFLVDCAAAAAAGLAFGLPPEAVSRSVSEASPGPHRGTVVAEVRSVRFVDDSKATNPHAVLASLEGRAGVVLIAGGLAKGVDLSPLAGAADRLRAVVAIGEAAPALVRVFHGRAPVERAGSMEAAVATAFELAAPGDEVLLAPGCASMDMFRDYRERGDRFAAAARALALTTGGDDGDDEHTDPPISTGTNAGRSHA